MKINKDEDHLLQQIAARLVPINVHSCEKHYLKGSEILEWESVTEIDGEPIIPEKMYVWRYPVITEMNHYRRLKKIWKARSDEDKINGVMAYMYYIEGVVKRNMEEKNIPIPEPASKVKEKVQEKIQDQVEEKKKVNFFNRLINVASQIFSKPLK